MSSKVQREGYTIIKIDSQPLPDERSAFLIDGLVSSTLTLLYGEPKSGKSTLAAALAVAVANGHPTFLGRPIVGTGSGRVGIVAGDPGDDDEYARALHEYSPADDRLQAFAFARPPQQEHWQKAIFELQSWGAQLVIIDNLAAFSRDVNDQRTVSEVLDKIDQLTRSGVAVVLVHHTSEKKGQFGASTVPMGTTAISAAARWKVRTGLPKDGPLTLTCEGNHGPTHKILASRPEGVPVFDVIETQDADELSRRRQGGKRDEIAGYVMAECQRMTNRQAAAKLAERFGGKASSYESSLSRRRYGVVRDESGEWLRIAA